MRIAPIAAPIAVPQPPAATGRAASPVPTPAERFSKRYNSDLLAIAGVMSTAYSNRVPDEVKVAVPDSRAAAMLAGLIRPVVDGVRLTIISRDTNTPYTGPASTDVAARVRSVASMRGVWNYYYTGTGYANARVTFETVDQDTVDRLRALIVDSFAAGTDDNGDPRSVAMTWRAGLHSS